MSETSNRPIAITVICIIGFLGALLTIPIILSPIARQIGGWYPPYLAFSAGVGLVCMIGLWAMKQWAAYLYIGLVALNQIVLMVMGVWNIMALIIPGVVIFFAMKHVNEMS